MDNRYIFVTGTDTGVGKTLVTLGLSLILQKNGVSFSLIKPIETGCDPEPEDGKLYNEILFPETEIDKLVPYQYKLPASPYQASKEENQKIQFNELIDKITNFSKTLTIIEGAGGLLVPITEDKTYLDLIKELDAEVIVVAANKLGMINHTLLTCNVLNNEKIQSKIIINDIHRKKNRVTETNGEQIELFSDCEIIMRLPYFHKKVNKKNILDWVIPFENTFLNNL